MYVEACLDFPEEDIDFINEGNVKDKLQNLSYTMINIMQCCFTGAIIKRRYKFSASWTAKRR